MRGRVARRAVAGGAEACLDHRGDRAFAVGAAHDDRAEGAMRVARHSLFLAALLVSLAAPAAEQFKRKECLDCHQKFSEQVLSRKNVHAIVKQQKCEDCHLRHGIVPKLLLKEAGNALCLKCHEKKSIGLDKRVVHPVLRTGDCTQCHDAHGSNARFMLKAEGYSSCFSCHKQEAFQRMKRFASNHNRKLVDVSAAVLTAEEIFHNLDAL